MAAQPRTNPRVETAMSTPITPAHLGDDSGAEIDAIEPAQLEVPFIDVRADELQWSLTLGDQPILAHRLLEVGDFWVELRVLGASHQVVVERDGKRLWCETLACELDGEAQMPAEYDEPGYRFVSRIDRPEAFAQEVTALLDRVAAVPGALIAEFPGEPHAFTAIEPVHSPAPGWRTWHTYPQSGEIVATETSLAG